MLVVLYCIHAAYVVTTHIYMLEHMVTAFHVSGNAQVSYTIQSILGICAFKGGKYTHITVVFINT